MKSKPSSTAWTVWAVVSIFYAYQYILRVMPSVFLYDIIGQFNISAATFGQFSGIYYIGYSLMHLPIGILLDRKSPRNVITFCILLTVLGMAPLLFSTYWVYPILGRCLIGIGSSAAILGVFKVIRMTFSSAQFPRMLSLSVTIGLTGAIYGGGPMNAMRDFLGYKPTLLVFTALGLLLALTAYLLLPKDNTESKQPILSHISEVMKNKRVLWCCLSAGLLVSPLEGFADVWGGTFLRQVYGFNATLAAGIPSLVFVGMCFGAPLLSFIADKIRNYLLTIVIAGAIMMLSFLALLLWQIPPTLLSINFIIVGVCSAYQILAIYKASTYVREEVAGLTTAVANMIIMTFGYAFHALMGGVIAFMGGTMHAEALWYGMLVIPIALFFGSAGFSYLLLSERGKKDLTIPV